MPHIIFKGIDMEDVKRIEKLIVKEISILVNCPVDHFTVEWTPTIFITQGVENTGGYPFVNINWFKRSREQRDEAAKIITNQILDLGYTNVCVYFNEIEPSAYYENGMHY